MIIRTATREDTGDIKLLLNRNFDEIMAKYHSGAVLARFKEHNSLESVLAQLKWKKVYVVENDEGSVVATGAFANFGSLELPKYCISNLYVLPEKHSAGIGRMLFERLLEDAKANSAESFHVPSSRNAVGFYEKMGFRVDLEQPDEADEITWMTMIL